MALTEAQRRANNKYIKEHMTTVACKLRKEQAERFKVVCSDNGVTPNEVLKVAMNDFLLALTGEPLDQNQHKEYKRWDEYLDMLKSLLDITDIEVKRRMAIPVQTKTSPTQSE